MFSRMRMSGKLAKEDQLHPMVVYMQSILSSYLHYFKFESEIPTNLNEREAFVDCTWSFIRGAFTMTSIPIRILEVTIDGNKDLLRDGLPGPVSREDTDVYGSANASYVFCMSHVISLQEPTEFRRMDLYQKVQPQPEHQQGVEGW
ncbi:MAG: hypothetical protein J3Q66DRAFT_374798 [Benniella sp.]|nr:MAG: hypothetical protein J3Q66DRAFT_374798 [Benniella sp.]